jgi:putative transposase
VHLLIKSCTSQRNVMSDNNLSYPLSPIMFSIKRHVAREANKLLQRNGKFWQHESYDHVVRSAKEFRAVVSYILNNPVKADLVGNWTDYRWSFVKSGLVD